MSVLILFIISMPAPIVLGQSARAQTLLTLGRESTV
jgi:hypothetical protein